MPAQREAAALAVRVRQPLVSLGATRHSEPDAGSPDQGQARQGAGQVVCRHQRAALSLRCPPIALYIDGAMAYLAAQRSPSGAGCEQRCSKSQRRRAGQPWAEPAGPADGTAAGDQCHSERHTLLVALGVAWRCGRSSIAPGFASAAGVSDRLLIASSSPAQCVHGQQRALSPPPALPARQQRAQAIRQ